MRIGTDCLDPAFQNRPVASPPARAGVCVSAWVRSVPARVAAIGCAFPRTLCPTSHTVRTNVPCEGSDGSPGHAERNTCHGSLPPDNAGFSGCCPPRQTSSVPIRPLASLQENAGKNLVFHVVKIKFSGNYACGGSDGDLSRRRGPPSPRGYPGAGGHPAHCESVPPLLVLKSELARVIGKTMSHGSASDNY